MLTSQLSWSQTDVTQGTVNLGEVVISVNKTEETKKTVSQQVEVLTSTQIAALQAQTTADILTRTGKVFVQRSQMGGGSPVLRGFEANKILLVVDGVRMNNLIYRAGHLQNIISTDNASLDRMEILFGPSSTIYGSDALGGVIHMYTKKPEFSIDGKTNLKVNAFARYGSVNNEFTGHADFNIGCKKLASLTSITFSDFDHLEGGKNQNPFYHSSYGERPYYAERINGVDSLIKNDNRYNQVQSGYQQYDLLQKLSYRQNDFMTHGLNIQFSNTNDIPRYDRLTDPKGSGLNSAEWYYGPQTRLLTAYDMNRKNTNRLFQNIHLGLNYQYIVESRHNRNFGSNFKNHREEKVNVIGANLDFQRVVSKHNIRFGADIQLNNLTSKATREDIVADTSINWSTRYPDGDNSMNNYSAYISHTWKLNDQLTITDGLRLGYSTLKSTFKDTVRPPDPLPAALPFKEVSQNTPVYSGSLGVIHSPTEKLKLSLLFSTGYRVPNIDDVTKMFDPAPGTVIVPNEDLKPEMTLNYELGVTNIFGESTSWENVIYYTDYIDAIVTDEFSYNGQDSIMYDGTMSRVYANQNKGKAYVYGFSSEIRSTCGENLYGSFGLNYTYGRVKTDSTDVPLDHIPPFMMHLQLGYTNDRFGADFSVNYNGWKKIKDYSPGGEDNGQYATPEGMPAWFTLNLRCSYKVHRLITLQAGVENILDTQYRAFASGINAPGRNVFGAIRFHY